MQQRTHFLRQIMLLTLSTAASIFVYIRFEFFLQRHAISAHAQEVHNGNSLCSNQSTSSSIPPDSQSICSSQSTSSNPPTASNPNTDSINNSLASLEQAVFDQVNQYRVKKGLSPLTLNDSVSAQARTHSQDMASDTVPLGHQGFGERVQALTKVIPLSAVAENVAYNQGYSDPVIQAVQGWLKSTGHRQNIEGNYDLTGIGVAKNSKGEYYFTQIFVSSILTNNRVNGTNEFNGANGTNGTNGANGISSTSATYGNSSTPVNNSADCTSTSTSNSSGSSSMPTSNSADCTSTSTSN